MEIQLKKIIASSIIFSSLFALGGESLKPLNNENNLQAAEVTLNFRTFYWTFTGTSHLRSGFNSIPDKDIYHQKGEAVSASSDNGSVGGATIALIIDGTSFYANSSELSTTPPAPDQPSNPGNSNGGGSSNVGNGGGAHNDNGNVSNGNNENHHEDKPNESKPEEKPNNDQEEEMNNDWSDLEESEHDSGITEDNNETKPEENKFDAEAFRTALLDRINQARAELGLSSGLTISPKYQAQEQGNAQAMADALKLEHGLGGANIARSGYNDRPDLAADNIVQQILDEGPNGGHYKEVFSNAPKIKYFSIGVAQGSDEQVYFSFDAQAK